MYPSYDDIISRIAEPPAWWSDGVPRYGDFHPSRVSIYSDVAVLLEIGTTDGHVYRVAKVANGIANGIELFTEMAQKGDFEVRDPPNYRTIVPANTADQYRVLEFWVRERNEWRRRPELELPLMDHDERT